MINLNNNPLKYCYNSLSLLSGKLITTLCIGKVKNIIPEAVFFSQKTIYSRRRTSIRKHHIQDGPTTRQSSIGSLFQLGRNGMNPKDHISKFKITFTYTGCSKEECHSKVEFF